MKQALILLCKISLVASAVTVSSCTVEPVPPPTKPPRFNQQRAYAQLVQLCALGPRNNASEGKRAAELLIQKVLKEAGAEVSLHAFDHTASGSLQPAHFTNIVGRIKPQETRRVLIGTHYDTRAWADRDSDEQKRSTPIIGANDGGSGVAVMLELAMTWKDDPPAIGVDLIFFDGEDFGSDQIWNDYFSAPKHGCRDYPNYKPEWGVIIDMVGDSSFEIKQERDSMDRAPAVVSKLWRPAKRLQSAAFREREGGRIMDDHTGFFDKQIPVILLIDFSPCYFHTTQDLPTNVRKTVWGRSVGQSWRR